MTHYCKSADLDTHGVSSVTDSKCRNNLHTYGQFWSICLNVKHVRHPLLDVMKTDDCTCIYFQYYCGIAGGMKHKVARKIWASSKYITKFNLQECSVLKIT